MSQITAEKQIGERKGKDNTVVVSIFAVCVLVHNYEKYRISDYFARYCECDYSLRFKKDFFNLTRVKKKREKSDV